MSVRSWQDWLDSLSTQGGNIVTLFLCSVTSGALWMWMLHRHAENDVMMAAYGVFTGFTGALLQAQKSNSSKQQMVDRTAATVLPIVTQASTEPNPTGQDGMETKT